MTAFLKKIIVVTGAAGNLGSATAQAFAEAGAEVCAVDHRHGRLRQELNGDHLSGHYHYYEGFDLTEASQVDVLASQIQDALGSVDVLVNTVGGFTAGERVHEMSSATWSRMFSLNVSTLLNTAAAFVPLMLSKAEGKIVNVSARSGLKGPPKMAAYAAAKSVVIRLTESMAAELKKKNIQVNCVLPGTIDTPQNREDMPDADVSEWVEPMQIARVIRFLASPAADDITGASIPVFG